MKTDWLVKSLLLLAVIFLGIIALRPYLAPPVVRAQSEDVYPITFGPSRVIALNPSAYEGNVVLDLRNGNVWQFPQFAPRLDVSDKSPRVSHPVLLGRFALEDLNKK
ncbi:MAG: hypothetical protein ABSF45_30445 [Terriglobia bacterium]